MLAMLSTGIARETRLRDRGELVIDASLSPDVQDGVSDLVLLMRVTTSLEGDRETIRNLRLRLNEEMVREASVRVVSPPAATEDLGGGHYFVWSDITPGQTIKMRLHPYRALTLTLVANGFERYLLQISPAKKGYPPLALRPNRSN